MWLASDLTFVLFRLGGDQFLCHAYTYRTVTPSSPMRTPSIMMMRYSVVILMSIGIFADDRAMAQEEPMRTLFSGGITHNGGWGAPTATYTRIMDQDAMLAGIRGGWIIDHRFTLGIAGQGLVTKVSNPGYGRQPLDIGQLPQGDAQFFLGYGGLLLEPVIAYRSPVHIALPIIIGAGGCGYYYSDQIFSDDPYFEVIDSQGFFLLEPGVELEMNVIRLVRFGLGLSYRFTSNLDLPGTSATALHGWNAGISVKVGSF